MNMLKIDSPEEIARRKIFRLRRNKNKKKLEVSRIETTTIDSEALLPAKRISLFGFGQNIEPKVNKKAQKFDSWSDVGSPEKSDLRVEDRSVSFISSFTTQKLVEQ